MADQIQQTVEKVPGVADCHQIRVRHSGPHLFIDIHVHMDGNQTLRQAHELSDRIELLLQESFPDADVTVHPEPTPDSQPA
jgi:ferrous-iron efflux pump FieF